MAENGILDYQGMNQAIYRGATSNIVVDTQSMSIEIGAGNSSHTSNLHIECDHAANVASIQLNSNVVTEFSRSKKLMKFPRVALTANSSGGYVASAHSEYPDGTNYHAFRVFNNRGVNVPYVAGVGWESANTDTFGDNGLWGGSPASGAPTSSSANTTMTLEEGNTIYGEWLQIQLPTKIRLEYVNFLILSGSAHAMAHRAPRAGYVLGSNNGTNWTTLKNWSGIVYDTWTAYYDKFYKFDIDKEVDNYQYFRFVWTETASGSGNSLSRYASCQELEFWGVPEYDPEAHGTDVTVKSYPNVPNTDWLEVYYDAKGLADNSTTVNDLKPVGTAVNGVVNGNTSVTDGAFTFDGSGDYIQGTFSGHTLSSGYTMATWIKPGDIGVDDYIATFGVGSTGTSFGINFETVGGAFRAFIWGPSTPGIVAKTGSGAVAKDEWVHIAATFISASGSIHLYIDNKLAATGTGTTITSISASAPLVLGARNGGGTIQRHANFTMANFRLFNRALTSDEIYQLYAYQKQDFGHSTNNMTLKAGRLGIGTSEPRGALDVRGDIIGGCPVFFRAWKSTDTIGGVNPIIWNEIMVNKGSGYSTVTGKFTAPVSGYYEFIYGGCSGRTDWSAEMHAHKNDGNRIVGASAYAAGGSGHWGRQLVNTMILELNVGDTFHLSQPGTGTSSQDMYGGSTYSYNFFSGKYLSN